MYNLLHLFRLALALLCYGIFANVYGLQYMCVDGGKKIKIFCQNQMNDEVCNDCPMNTLNADTNWCFCQNNISFIATSEGQCIPKEVSLLAPIMSLSFDNYSMIVSDAANTVQFLTIKNENNISLQEVKREYLAIDMNCSIGGSFFEVRTPNTTNNACLDNYIYEFVDESDHIFFMKEKAYNLSIYTTNVTIELIDSISFYGETCTFVSKVKSPIAVHSPSSPVYFINIKPMAAPFRLQWLLIDNNNLFTYNVTEEDVKNYTDVFVGVQQINESYVYVVIDPSHYSLLTYYMKNAIVYKFAGGDLSNGYKDNISQIHHTSKIIVSLKGMNHEIVHEVIKSATNNTITNTSEWNWWTELILIPIHRLTINDVHLINVNVIDGQNNEAFENREVESTLNLMSWYVESSKLLPSNSQSCQPFCGSMSKWIVVIIALSCIAFVLAITLFILVYYHHKSNKKQL